MMITNNIGQVSFLNARLHGCKKIFFVGSFLRQNSISCRRLAFAIDFWSQGQMEAFFLEHDGYFGAIGTFLQSAYGEKELDRVLQSQSLDSESENGGGGGNPSTGVPADEATTAAGRIKRNLEMFAKTSHRLFGKQGGGRGGGGEVVDGGAGGGGKRASSYGRKPQLGVTERTRRASQPAGDWQPFSRTNATPFTKDDREGRAAMGMGMSVPQPHSPVVVPYHDGLALVSGADADADADAGADVEAHARSHRSISVDTGAGAAATAAAALDLVRNIQQDGDGDASEPETGAETGADYFPEGGETGGYSFHSTGDDDDDDGLPAGMESGCGRGRRTQSISIDSEARMHERIDFNRK
jgi:hypothetical protein